MGSAYKNKGVQLLLNRVHDLLPDPTEVTNTALNLDKDEEEVVLECDSNGPLVALAFKLQESQFGQLTYLRVYSGVIKKGETVVHINSGKKIKVPYMCALYVSGYVCPCMCLDVCVLISVLICVFLYVYPYMNSGKKIKMLPGCVCPCVSGQIRRNSERFLTHCTLVRFLSCVCPHVFDLP